MKLITSFITILIILFSTTSLKSQEPGLDVSSGDEAQFAPSPGDAAREWLDERCSNPKKRCLIEGFNEPEKEGQSTVYLAIGTGYSSMPKFCSTNSQCKTNCIFKSNAKRKIRIRKSSWNKHHYFNAKY